jgi:membrane protein DedA with SNARE-associated domain
MTAAGFGDALIQFVRTHEHWAAPVVFVLAFFESFAFVSLVVPATVVLFGISGLLGAAGIEFWPVYTAAVLGAFAGDWLAFELALYFKQGITNLWPISKHPELLRRGFYLFGKWGIIIVFIGRFFGPLRAAVPLVAGIMEMPRLKFQLANFGSAVIWAAGILAPGALGMRWLLG